MTSVETQYTFCNTCGGDKRHDVLFTHAKFWESKPDPVYGQVASGSETYQMLMCGGCESVKLHWVSESDGDPITTDYPPKAERKFPRWLNEIGLLADDYEFVDILSREIYGALENRMPNLAMLGIRALLEKTMITKVGDAGTIEQNITNFANEGHISQALKQTLKGVFELGNATMHRNFSPRMRDVIAALDTAETLLHGVLVHGQQMTALGMRIEAAQQKVPKKEPKRKTPKSMP